MKLIDAHTQLKKLNLPVFQTKDVSALLKISLNLTNKILSRLASSKILIHVNRGIWSFPDVDPLLLPGFITQPFPTYISLQTALYYHGMVSQIPSTIYAVSLARTKLYKTPLGNISVHHVQPSFFFGFELKESGMLNFASAEKALIDTLYLSQGKSRLFSALPEVELPANFNISAAKKMISKIQSRGKKHLVERKFNELLSQIPNVV